MPEMADAIDQLAGFLGNRQLALQGTWDLYAQIVGSLCVAHHPVQEGQPFTGVDAGQHCCFCDEARSMTIEAITKFCNGG